MPEYTKEQLITICEQAVVDEGNWHNRDSDNSQCGVGKAWVYLKAGVPFKVLTNGSLTTDDRTIWLEFYPKDFGYFEGGNRGIETIYLPTVERLQNSTGNDWY